MRLRPVISLVLLAFLGAASGLQAQGVIVGDHVRDVDGMRGAVVLSTFSDSAGRVWIGTDAGLNIFGADGVHPVELGRELVLVSVIAEQPKGVIWVGHGQGLGRLQDGEFVAIAFPGSAGNPIGGPRVAALVPDDARSCILVGTADGLYRVGDSGAEPALPIEVAAPGEPSVRQIVSLVPTRASGFLVGTAAGTFRLGADDRAELLFRFEGRDLSQEMRAPRAMLELPDGRIAVGGSMGTSIFEPLTGKLEGLPGVDLRATRTLSLAGTPDGGFWGCSPYTGLWRWNPQDEKLWRFDLRPRNGDLRVSPELTFGVQRSAEGILWVATPNGMLFFADEPRLPLVFMPRDDDGDGFTRIHEAVAADDGSIWLATGRDGLQRMATSGALLSAPSLPGPRPAVEFMSGDAAGRVLVLTAAKKLMRVTAEGVTEEPLPLLPDDAGPLGVFLRQSGDLVVLTDAGVFEVSAAGTSRELQHDGRSFAGALAANQRNVLEDDRGDLWLLTAAGTFRIDPAGRAHRHGLSDPATVAVKLPGDQAMAAVDLGSGRLLLTIAGRLGILDVDAGSYASIALRHPTGRPVGFIHDLLRDRDGRIWGLTSATLLRIDLQEGSARECQVFMARSNAILSHLQPGPGGRIVITSGESLVIFDPNEEQRATLPPAPELREVSILGDRQSLSASPSPRILPEDHNRLSFAVTSNDHLNRERLRYSMRLVGAADDWQDVGRDGRIHYAGLPAGEYRLEARAENGSGDWTEPVTLYRFVLRPPVWKTLTFQLGAGLLLGIVAMLGFRRQVGLERRRSAALERVVAERTESLRTKSEELERLHDVVRDINAATTLEELLKITLGESITVLEADAGRFYIRSNEGWKLAIALGWEAVAGAAPSAALLAKLSAAGPPRPIEQLREWPADVVECGSRRSRETCSLMMILSDEGDTAACMMLDFHHRMGEAEPIHITMVERLCQPVTLAYRKLRLLETAEELNDRKNELLGAAAHDLRNPITVIA